MNPLVLFRAIAAKIISCRLSNRRTYLTSYQDAYRNVDRFLSLRTDSTLARLAGRLPDAYSLGLGFRV